MEADWADEQAQELLPCQCGAVESKGETHFGSCHAFHRSAVATVLRAEQERGDAACFRLTLQHTEELQARDEEIEQLKALDATTAKAYNANLIEMGYMRLEIERLKAESAARLEALQLIASGQRANGQTVGPMHAYQMQNVARAEIDKAKGES